MHSPIDQGRDSRIIILVKTADETVNNSAALQDDDDLQFTCASGVIYHCDYQIRINSDPAADFKYQITAPALSVGSFYSRDPNNGDGHNEVNGAATLGTSGNDYMVHIVCTVKAGAAGTIKLQWSQAAAVAVDTKVLTGSSLFVVAK